MPGPLLWPHVAPVGISPLRFLVILRRLRDQISASTAARSCLSASAQTAASRHPNRRDQEHVCPTRTRPLLPRVGSGPRLAVVTLLSLVTPQCSAVPCVYEPSSANPTDHHGRGDKAHSRPHRPPHLRCPDAVPYVRSIVLCSHLYLRLMRHDVNPSSSGTLIHGFDHVVATGTKMLKLAKVCVSIELAGSAAVGQGASSARPPLTACLPDRSLICLSSSPSRTRAVKSRWYARVHDHADHASSPSVQQRWGPPFLSSTPRRWKASSSERLRRPCSPWRYRR